MSASGEDFTKSLGKIVLAPRERTSRVTQTPLSMSEGEGHQAAVTPAIWPHLFYGAGHEKRRGEQVVVPGI